MRKMNLRESKLGHEFTHSSSPFKGSMNLCYVLDTMVGPKNSPTQTLPSGSSQSRATRLVMIDTI